MTKITRRAALRGGGAILPASLLGSCTNLALAKIFEMPIVDGPDDRHVWTLVRELEARCEDFARLEAVYDSSEAAHHYFYDACQGIVETAKCIHWSEQLGVHDAEILEWVSSIYPDDVAWVLRREPPINGLSERFVELNLAFDDAMRGLANWSAWPINPLHGNHEQWDDTVKALKKFSRTTDALLRGRALTTGDRALKRRAIEHLHCGLGGKYAKAKYGYGLPDPPPLRDLALAVELNRARGFTQLRCRTDWRAWQWIYS